MLSPSLPYIHTTQGVGDTFYTLVHYLSYGVQAVVIHMYVYTSLCQCSFLQTTPRRLHNGGVQQEVRERDSSVDILRFNTTLAPSRERERSHSHPHTHTHTYTHTGGFVSSLYGISGQFLQQEHEQFPPFLHAGVEEGLIPYLTLVPQILVTHTHTTTTTTTNKHTHDKDFHQVVFSACDLPSRSRD